MYALEERNLGACHLAEYTFYTFRRRNYEYTIEHPEQEDLIFGQFKALTNHFIQDLGVNTQQQCMDSPFFMSNIKLAGRLSLAHDVVQALKTCPGNSLPNKLQEVFKPEFKAGLLYRSCSSQIPERLQEMFNLSAALLELAEEKEIAHSYEISLVRRFLSEQTFYDQEAGVWYSKESNVLKAASLQPAYNPNAAFRSKSGKENKGCLFNTAETCNDENPVQLIIDASDVNVLEDRLPEIKNNTAIKDLYVDGGYYSEDAEKITQEQDVNMHYTNMTGKAPNPEKLPLTAFEIDENFNVISCSEKYPVLTSSFQKKSGIVNAHFSLEHYQRCLQKENCPVKLQKKSAVLRANQKAVQAAYARERTFCKPLRKEAANKRTAAEGSISAIKRSQGANKLKVCTYLKYRLLWVLK